MKTGADTFKNVLRRTLSSLPLRRELMIVKHYVCNRDRKIRVGMSIGFADAGVNQLLSQLGGYWVSVEFTKDFRDLVASALGDDRVAALGINGQIPFEDKQFDTIVVSSSSIFFDGFTLPEIIKESHRILDTGGLFVITLPRRKSIGLARKLGGLRGRIENEQAYTEKQIFELLKRGFDVLGVKFHSRFWVQLVRELLEKDGFADGGGALPQWVIRLLYSVAAVLDFPLFFNRRYNVTVCCQRKGWRGQQGGLLNGHTAVVSNAMFYDLKKSRNTFSIARFNKD